jgi:hypothetical protein
MLTVFSTLYFAQNCHFISTDIQGNQYFLDKNELTKVSENNAGTFAFSNKTLGTLTQIEVNNAMRPLLFYGDVQKLVITDNTLSKQNQNIISFEEIGMYQITCIASSRMDNGIWLYDQELFQIVKIDQHLNRTIETGNLKQLLALENLEPIKMMEMNGFLYVHCANNGLLVFDIYGTYYKTIPLLSIDTWNIMNDQLLYTSEGKAYSYDIKTLEIMELCELTSSNPIWIDGSKVYSCNEGKLIQQIYKTN